MERPKLSLLVLLIGGALLLGASQIPSLREPVAAIVLFGAPLALGVATWLAHSTDGRARVLIAMGVVAGVAGTELVVYHAMFPGPPVAEVDLSNAASEAKLDLPSSAMDLDVEIDAAVPPKGAVDGHAIVTLERSGHSETLNAHFARIQGTMRMGRQRVRGGSGSAHDEEHFRVALPGPGPLVARLTSIDGGMGTKVHLALRSENGLWTRTLPPIALVLALLISAVEWQSGEARRASRRVARVGSSDPLSSHAPRAPRPLRIFAGLGVRGAGWRRGGSGTVHARRKEAFDRLSQPARHLQSKRHALALVAAPTHCL